MQKKHYAGVMLSEAPFLNIPVLFAKSGLDFLLIDTEHGGFDYSTLSALIMNSRLSGIKVIIRIPDNQRKDILRMMDMGADGLLLPMTNTKKDIEQVVKYAKYSPIGERGISATRAHTDYYPPNLDEYMLSTNDRTMIFAQIETKDGIEHIEEILATPGVFGAMVGPNDLSCDLKCLGQTEPILPVLRIIADAASKYDKASGIITTNEKLLIEAERVGMRWFSIGSELNMLKTGCKTVVETVKELGGNMTKRGEKHD